MERGTEHDEKRKRGGKRTLRLSVDQKEYIVTELLGTKKMKPKEAVSKVKEMFNMDITREYIYGIKCQYKSKATSCKIVTHRRESFSNGIHGGRPRKLRRALEHLSKLNGFQLNGLYTVIARFC